MLLNKKRISLFACVLYLFSGCTLYNISKLVGIRSQTEELSFYKFACSKREINFAIKKVLTKYTEFIPPDKYKKYLIHNYPDLTTPESRAWNADSIQFHFYFKTKQGNEYLYWVRFIGHQKNWNINACTLVLEEYFDGKETITKSKFNFFKPLKMDSGIIVFEKEILEKIRVELVGVKTIGLEHLN